MKMYSTLGAATVLAVAALAAAGVTTAAAPLGGSASSSTVRIGTNAPPDSFDPAKADVGPALQYKYLVYATLIHQQPNGSLVPELATSWKFNANNTVLTLNLRRGVKFSDSSPFNARVAKRNLDRAKATNGPRAAQLARVKKVTAAGTYTLRIVLASPDPALPFNLSTTLGMMASGKALDNPTDLAQNPVGAGAYVLDRSRTVNNDHYTYVRNKLYWNKAAYAYDTVVIREITDTNAELQALQAGQLDVSYGLPANADTAQRSGLTVLSTPSNSMGLFLLDRGGQTLKPLGDVRVRQALNYAVDRAAIVKAVAKGYGTPTSQLLSPGLEGYDPSLDGYYTYNPAKAKQLLQQAGFGGGFELPVTSFSLFDTETQAIAGYLKAIGVDMKIDDVQPADYIPSIIKAKNPAAFLPFGLQNSFADIQQLLLPTGLFNPLHSDDKTISSLWKQGAAAPTAKRIALYKKLSAQVVKQAWFLETYYQKGVYFVSPRVKGVRMYSHQIVPVDVRGWRPS